MRSPLVVPAGRRLSRRRSPPQPEAATASGRRSPPAVAASEGGGWRPQAVTVSPPHGDRLRGAVTACPTLVRRPTLVPSLPSVPHIGTPRNQDLLRPLDPRPLPGASRCARPPVLGKVVAPLVPDGGPP